MLLLFETAAGYAIFKVLDEGKLQKAEVGEGLPSLFLILDSNLGSNFLGAFAGFVDIF